MNVAVLASGSGTILASMIDQSIAIELVVADRACRALGIAEEAGIACELVERRDYSAQFDRDRYTQTIATRLEASAIDLVVMAGFGTIFGAPIYARFSGRVLNTHPSLLPAFPGWHAVEQALDYGVRVTGCTVHVAELEVDAGPILAQRAVEVIEGDTVETLHERIKVVERELYVSTVAEIIARRWVIKPGDLDPEGER